MSRQSLAVKYRPQTFEDVSEQESIKIILKQQLETNTVKNAYLFCGGAGTGKTTCARIFANEINNHSGVPIEIDSASNNSVDDVREIIQQAQTQSLDGNYKIFILDEVHMLSNGAWNAMLKLLEEPPKKSIFIMCTTDPQKIPKTILSRVQRYDFRKISQDGIANRLHTICVYEEIAPIPDNGYSEALNYIAKIADGGMRDAITLMDKCLSYSTVLSVENVVNALGLVDYTEMIKLTNAFLDNQREVMIDTVENIHKCGKDLKTFIRNYVNFILDVNKYQITKSFAYIKIPQITECSEWLNSFTPNDCAITSSLLELLIKLNSEIKYDSNPKDIIEAMFLIELQKYC